MLIQEHLKQLVWMAAPWLQFHHHAQGASDRDCPDCNLHQELLADIKPIKFGNNINWTAAADYALADYQIPRDSFNIVMRVECYTVDWTSGEADFGMSEPPPPGVAWWQYTGYGTSGVEVITDQNAQVQLLLDSDEFLVFRPGMNAQLIGSFAVSPDGITREVRTLVYSYNCGAAIADRIGILQAMVPVSG